MAAASSRRRTASSSGSLFGGKLILLIPLVVIAAGLWFLLRHFGGRKKAQEEAETAETAIPQAWVANETLDTEFEEVSLETGIKLDVARAYMEVGDAESAQQLLQDVMQEGTDKQKSEAGELLRGV